MNKGNGWLAAMMARLSEALGRPRDHAVDISLGHAAAPRLLELLRARRWAESEQLFLPLRTDERFILLTYCANQPLPLDDMAAWVTRSPFVGGLFRGTALTFAAWEARSSARGAQVSEAQFASFHELLAEAWRTLMAAHEAETRDPEPLTRLIPVAMGLEAGDEAVRELFNGVLASGTPHPGAAFYATEALSAKWLGSEEMALDFARDVAQRHPLYRSALACAHVENWLWELVEKRDPDYFQRDAVRSEMRECWARETLASRTDYFRFHALNYYAFCLQAIGAGELLRGALVMLGAQVTEKPWLYRGDPPVLTVNKARQKLELPQI